MQPHSRIFSRALLSIGLVLLGLEPGDRRADVARTTAGAWTYAGSWPADPPASRRAEPDEATKQRVNDQYGRLPLSFEKNDGQTDPRVAFLSRGPGYALFLSDGGEAVIALGGASPAAPRDARGPASGPDLHRAAHPAIEENDATAGRATAAALRLTLVGADQKAAAEGREALPGTVNYLRGSDRTRWRAGIPTYARVAYDNIYPGVDLVYYGNQRQLEYDFIVQPGADPRAIMLEADGADRLEVDAGGDLVMHVGNRQVRQHKPVVYQEVDGVRRELEGRYALQGSRRVTFQLGAYDPTRALVIDPVLAYSTYLGGTFSAGASEFANDVALDAFGRVYLTGFTESSDFPTTIGTFDTSLGGDHDVFVTKLDPTGALAYSTFLGGNGEESGQSIAVDVTGQAYVTGSTGSRDFPTTVGAYDTSPSDTPDAFVTKLDAAGATLVYSTFLGGNGDDVARGVAVDLAGQVSVTGFTESGDFPTTAAAYDRSFNGRKDAFVTKLDAAGTTLVYSTFLGGAGEDGGWGVAVDAAGSAYVTGETAYADDFPTTAGAYDTSFNGNSDVFVTKLDAAGATLMYSTFLGGAGVDGQFEGGVAVDGAGRAYVTGYTESSGFPTTVGAHDTSRNGGYDVFVTKLDATGATLAYSTFLGGSGGDFGRGVAVDGAGRAYVVGTTESTNDSNDFPTTAGAYDTSFNGSSDVFVTKLDATGATLLYSTFLGGSDSDEARDIVVDGTGNAYVTGYTASANFPTTAGAHDTTFNGGRDIFVTKLNATGSAPLVYSTYIGGNLLSGSNNQGLGVTVDGTGSAYVTGFTVSPDFPTTVGTFDTSYNGDGDDFGGDVFVAKLDATGATLVYSTFLGGSDDDVGWGVAVDGAGQAVVTGETRSSDFPTTVGAYDTSFNGGKDVFVTKLGAAGSTLVYSTFLGGGSDDRLPSVAVDEGGHAYVTGSTVSGNFPTTVGGYDPSYNGGGDVFVTKLETAGAMLAYSTFLGGSSEDFGADVAVDGVGNIYVTGFTRSSDFSTTVGAYDTSFNGVADVFVTKLDAAGTTLVYSTFLGGGTYETGAGVAVDAGGNAYVTGGASSDFPTTVGAYDTSLNGFSDVFVTKLDAAGATLVYSTFLGGNDYDGGQAIAVDGGGQAYVTGQTRSSNFPTTAGAIDTSWNYSQDAFVAKLDAAGATLAYSTFLGGTDEDEVSDIALDEAGNAYVTGSTQSPRTFPTTPGAYDTSHSGSIDVFVTKISDVGPPAPSLTVTANGVHAPLTLAPGDPLTIALSFDAGSVGIVDPAEVYIGVSTRFGLLWFDRTSQRFVPAPTPVYAGPLSSFGPLTLIHLPNASVLLPGPYAWVAVVDHDSNNEPDFSVFDSVLTSVPWRPPARDPIDAPRR